MHYLALGDSISIDDYTGVPGGGAASQLAVRLKVTRFQDRTRDGNVTKGVLMDLERFEGMPDLITVTIGGNDLLMGEPPGKIVRNIEQIAGKLARYPARVILNTVYDPTDGDDTLADSTGLAPELRGALAELNEAIRRIAGQYQFILSDLELVFRGHGLRSADCWYTQVIEPNFRGATYIARHWCDLLAPGAP